MDQGRGEVDVKDREEEDHMDHQSNQEEGDHPHLECKRRAGSAGMETGGRKRRRQRRQNKDRIKMTIWTNMKSNSLTLHSGLTSSNREGGIRKV